ncbi:hypothetical protein BC332_13334 [Capsicum chinense]|nr:hypothetical protein BC332_13334 [Capsicum chinense]
MNHILGAPPVIRRLDSKNYAKVLYKARAVTKPISKRFKMTDISKYDGNTDPMRHEHILFFPTAVNGTTEQEKKENWSCFVKAHTNTRKVQPRRIDISKIEQHDTELLREFEERFQRERMNLPMVPDDWAA